MSLEEHVKSGESNKESMISKLLDRYLEEVGEPGVSVLSYLAAVYALSRPENAGDDKKANHVLLLETANRRDIAYINAESIWRTGYLKAMHELHDEAKPTGSGADNALNLETKRNIAMAASFEKKVF